MRLIHTGLKGCTFHFQKSMPKLPIPKLEDTCARWLAAVTPLAASPSELAPTTEAVRSFQHSERARKLQQTLESRDSADKDNSYINNYWKDMYLREMREPLPLNVNPFLKLVDDRRTSDMCVRAASLVASSVRFLQALRNETLEPDVFHMGEVGEKRWFKNAVTLLVPQRFSYYAAYAVKSYPLDMSQYPWLFCTSRQAAEGRDVLYTEPTSRHIAVLSKNKVYTVDVLTSEGKAVSQSEILSALRWIRKQDPSASERGVGSLTALGRDDWAKARVRLLSNNSQNAASLQKLESAIFALCLDERKIDDASTSAAVFLHGRHNRWYDKSFFFFFLKKRPQSISSILGATV